MRTKIAAPSPGPSPAWPSVLARFKGVVFLIAGVWLLAGAAFAGSQAQRFLQRSEIGQGVVVRLAFGPAHGEVRFSTRQGGVVTYAQNGEVWLHAGQKLRVRYDPAKPDQGPLVDQFGAIWGTTVILGLMGAAFTAVGATLLRRLRRARVR